MENAIQSLQTIETSMTSAGRKVPTTIEKIAHYLKSEMGADQIEVVASVLLKLGNSVLSVTSDDAVKIVSGTPDIILAVTSLFALADPITYAMFSLIATILGAVGASAGGDFGSIVKREIEKALNRYEDSRLRDEAEGTIRQFRVSHAYLSPKFKEATVKENEIPALSANVPVYQGVKFLGVLSHRVKELSKSTNTEQVKQAMEYTQLYIILAVLRSAVLWEMCALLRTVPNNDFTAEAIQRVIEMEESHDKEFIEYLTQPDYSSAVFFSNFNPSEWPTIIIFLEKKGLSYQKLDHLAIEPHSLKPEKWPNHRMYMMNNPEGWIAGTEKEKSASKFALEPLSQEDNVFHIRSVKWPNWYVYMQKNLEGGCRGRKGKPGPKGEWKIVRFKDGKYMLATRRWPDWFLYMKGNYIGASRGWAGDPGTQGHWIITKVMHP